MGPYHRGVRSPPWTADVLDVTHESCYGPQPGRASTGPLRASLSSYVEEPGVES